MDEVVTQVNRTGDVCTTDQVITKRAVNNITGLSALLLDGYYSELQILFSSGVGHVHRFLVCGYWQRGQKLKPFSEIEC